MKRARFGVLAFLGLACHNNVKEIMVDLQHGPPSERLLVTDAGRAFFDDPNYGSPKRCPVAVAQDNGDDPYAILKCVDGTQVRLSLSPQPFGSSERLLLARGLELGTRNTLAASNLI